MPVESTAVELTINVTDGSSGEVIHRLKTAFGGLGNAGAEGGRKAGEGLKHISGHSLTALDNVRLLRDDLGIRIPRSMEKAIASSQVMMGMIGAVGKGLLAVGAIDIGLRIAQGLKKGYDAWFSAAAAVAAYQKEVEKTQQDDFGNSRSVEDTRARIEEATEALRQYREEAKQARQDQSRIGGNLVVSPFYWIE